MLPRRPPSTGNTAAVLPQDEYVFFAELPDIPETRAVLEKYLKLGAIGIGEQKFPRFDRAGIRVPVLLQFDGAASRSTAAATVAARGAAESRTAAARRATAAEAGASTRRT